MYNQSQGHGFLIENFIRENVFKLKPKKNDTSKFDIITCNENISIKTTGSKTLCMGSILSFFDYDFNYNITLIVIQYIQCDKLKIIKKIYEMNFCKECFEMLFENLNRYDVENYVQYIKSIPHGKVDKDIKKKYKDMKKVLESKSNCKITINPKVDSKNQRRVQCSIKNFETILEKYMFYESQDTLRYVKLPKTMNSDKRLRH